MECVCNEILCSEHSENDLRETVPFTGASERVKYSKINSMEVPDSCAESYKTELITPPPSSYTFSSAFEDNQHVEKKGLCNILEETLSRSRRRCVPASGGSPGALIEGALATLFRERRRGGVCRS